MQTDKPLISILMAVYEPNIEWLREQLISLNEQTYPNLRLYIRDDCSPTVSFEEIQSCVQDCISAFSVILQRNEKNLGSNLTFERLTQEAEGKYFSYCDQDDIWLPEKLEILQNEIERNDTTLVCSDMYIIDTDGNQTASSIQVVRKHHVFHSGKDLVSKLFIHNFVTGCTMMIRSKDAKAAIPFCPYMVHDHYLALWCSERGSLQSVMKPLIKYRIHGGNQTGLMTGVYDKESYGRVRIDSMVQRLKWLDEHFSCSDQTKYQLIKAITWAEARQKNWYSGKQKGQVWKYRYFSKMPSIFEICFRKLPEPLFKFVITLAKRNYI